MTLVKFNPGRTIRRDENFINFDNFVNDFFNSNHGYGSNTSEPSVNIRENKDNLILELAIPGFSKEDFNISIENKILTISLEKEEEEKNEKSYIRKEYNYFGFKRNFKIGNSINHDKVKATYNQGILEVVLEKKDEEKIKPSRQIEVK